MVLRGAVPQPSLGRKKVLPYRHTSSVVDHLLCMFVPVLWQRDIVHPPREAGDGEGSAVDGEGFAEPFRKGRVGAWGAPSAAPRNPVL